MKHYKLPFKIQLERKYNDITIEKYPVEREENEEDRKNWEIEIDNDLHIELGKFKTFEIPLSEIIDLGMRYALSKHEFRKMAAQLIEIKENPNKYYPNA